MISLDLIWTPCTCGEGSVRLFIYYVRGLRRFYRSEDAILIQMHLAEPWLMPACSCDLSGKVHA